MFKYCFLIYQITISFYCIRGLTELTQILSNITGIFQINLTQNSVINESFLIDHDIHFTGNKNSLIFEAKPSESPFFTLLNGCAMNFSNFSFLFKNSNDEINRKIFELGLDAKISFIVLIFFIYFLKNHFFRNASFFLFQT